jgi:hypothetical protein
LPARLVARKWGREKMGTDHVFMKGAKRRPEKRGLSPIFCGSGD